MVTRDSLGGGGVKEGGPGFFGGNDTTGTVSGIDGIAVFSREYDVI